MYFVSNFSGFYLPPGQTQLSEPPWSWNERIWARTGCKFDSNWQPACETGDCDGRLGHISPSCTSRGYSKNLNNLCPQELQVVNKNGEVVACKSSFLAFDIDLFCCRNEFGTPENTNGTCIQRYLSQTQLSEPPWSWNGRIWARTGCKFDSNWQPTCETGDCDGRLGHISPSFTSRQ
ncbi:hypothetical protein V6N11_031954 [Hibiscus sabdariffa]|uniref:Uncharacterized protein n=1 Tax=Hibiscus sabdariffa TaxID=183260 RepID=A0ABR2SZW0_9ROSI